MSRHGALAAARSAALYSGSRQSIITPRVALAAYGNGVDRFSRTAVRDSPGRMLSTTAVRSNAALKASAVRRAEVQHGLGSSSSSLGSSAGSGHYSADHFPPPSVPPQRRRASGNLMGVKRGTLSSASTSHASKTKQQAPAPVAGQSVEAVKAPKNDPERVGTTDSEDPPHPKEQQEQVPLPDDPNSPLRKEQPTPEEKPPGGPQPRRDPQGIKKRDQVKDAPKKIKEKIIGMWENVKYLFRFYYNGVKQIWKDRRIVTDLRKVIAQREAAGQGEMKWIEKSIIELHQSDVRKLPLFLAILVFLEEVLPLLVIYAPSLLPSTCVLPSQATKLQSEEERRRGTAIQGLGSEPKVTAAVAAIGQARPTIVSAAAQDGAQQPVAQLADLSTPTLSKLANVFALRAWGPKSLLLSRLNAHLTALQRDDIYLRQAYDARHTSAETKTESADVSVNQWSHICNSVWLQRACARRGLRAFEASEADMAHNLEAYLHLCVASTPSQTERLSPLEHALLPLALYDGSRAELVRLEIEASLDRSRGLRQRTSEIVASVVTAEKRREGVA